MKNILALVYTILITTASPVIVSAQKTEPSCIDCHASISNSMVKHEALENGCELCHMETGETHPQSNVKTFTLTEEMPALCFMCHEEHTKTNLHAVSTECLMCHSPHGSDYKSLLINSPQSALCAECHDMSMAEKQVKHKPVAEGNCASCHDPHQSELSYLLKEEKKQLCLKCHTSIQMQSELENIHPPFDDDCANCHYSHSSEEKALLVQKMPELCFNCHDMPSSIEKAAVVHKAINYKKGCSNCHSPHASDQSNFLLYPDKDLCLSCHNKTITNGDRTVSNIGEFLKSGNYIHAIIDIDGCSVCHNPHFSDQLLLLNEKFPVGQYAGAIAENFALCFMCHDSNLMTIEFTTSATNFRNGEQNMHFLHINGDKGRNCNVCHNVHGSANEHLIADKVIFAQWEMPIQYKIELNGGSCKTGCHGEKKYYR